jgi:hypothetical protein
LLLTFQIVMEKLPGGDRVKHNLWMLLVFATGRCGNVLSPISETGREDGRHGVPAVAEERMQMVFRG